MLYAKIVSSNGSAKKREKGHGVLKKRRKIEILRGRESNERMNAPGAGGVAKKNKRKAIT